MKNVWGMNVYTNQAMIVLLNISTFNIFLSHNKLCIYEDAEFKH